MKRLLTIKEFFLLKKRDLEQRSGDTTRPAKRPRKTSTTVEGQLLTTVCTANSPGVFYDKFLQLFDSEVARDCVWWLPGRRGEAFMMNKEIFEHKLMKVVFHEHNFSAFLDNLKRWGFNQISIASLSGRVLAFEKASEVEVGRSPSGSADHQTEAIVSHQHRQNNRRQAAAAEATHLPSGAGDPVQGGSSSDWANWTSSQLQQAHYMVQQEIAQTYFSLLWQELQRQLSVLLIQQSQVTVNNQRQQGLSLASSAGSEIYDVASLLHQQQLQQQVVAAQFIRATMVEPSRPTDQQTVVRELNDLQQQQLSNLTFQIVALVAANLEQQNQNPQLPEASMIHKILVKYLIALVLLQLQQQQHNLELLRQDRLTALALVRSVNGTDSSEDTVAATAASAGDTTASAAEAETEPISTAQMQQLLSEAAMLSLSRAHQLLAEAAILIPFTMHQSEPARLPPPPQQQDPMEQVRALLGGSLSPSPPPPRTTIAR